MSERTPKGYRKAWNGEMGAPHPPSKGLRDGLDAASAPPQAGTPPPNYADAAEMLWVVLANVSDGDWTKQTPEWQEAAARWRDYYFTAVRPPVVPLTPVASGAAPAEPLTDDEVYAICRLLEVYTDPFVTDLQIRVGLFRRGPQVKAETCAACDRVEQKHRDAIVAENTRTLLHSTVKGFKAGERFAASLLNPPEPNEALKQTARQVPKQFRLGEGGDQHNAQKAWLAGYDAAEARQHATQQAALRKLPRYVIDGIVERGDAGPYPATRRRRHAHGEWVRYEDVARLLGEPGDK